MATRSTIAVQHADGTVSQVYCHWDGYLEYNGRMLTRYYNTLEQAEALVALGDISTLQPSIEKPEGHTFDKKVEGYTVFYGRDRGETGTETRKFKSFEHYRKDVQGEEYNYLFRNGKWECEAYGEFYPDVAEELEKIAAEDDN